MKTICLQTSPYSLLPSLMVSSFISPPPVFHSLPRFSRKENNCEMWLNSDINVSDSQQLFMTLTYISLEKSFC